MTPPARVQPTNRMSEAERLDHLRSLGVLDTPADEGMQRIVTRARDALPGTSIAAISLVDADRQWFKAIVGLDATETPRSVSFCSHAIQGDGPLIVEDATKDPRFADNPLVTAGPAIRFYIGMPLLNGAGALCVIGTAPRKVSPAELKLVEGLASFVNMRLSLHALDRKLLRSTTADAGSASAAGP